MPFVLYKYQRLKTYKTGVARVANFSFQHRREKRSGIRKMLVGQFLHLNAKSKRETKRADTKVLLKTEISVYWFRIPIY